MFAYTGLTDSVVVLNTDRVADLSPIWILGAFMRSSLQRRITKLSLSLLLFTGTYHLRPSLE